jgi:hypothetical protein
LRLIGNALKQRFTHMLNINSYWRSYFVSK